MGDHAAETSSIEMHRETVNAEHRGEVASLSGLAAAVDEYEDAPHGEVTLRGPSPPRYRIPQTVRDVRQPSRSERLGA